MTSTTNGAHIYPAADDQVRAYLQRLAGDAHRLVQVVHATPAPTSAQTSALVHRILVAPAPHGVQPAHALALTLAALAGPQGGGPKA